MVLAAFGTPPGGAKSLRFQRGSGPFGGGLFGGVGGDAGIVEDEELGGGPFGGVGGERFVGGAFIGGGGFVAAFGTPGGLGGALTPPC